MSQSIVFCTFACVLLLKPPNLTKHDYLTKAHLSERHCFLLLNKKLFLLLNSFLAS